MIASVQEEKFTKAAVPGMIQIISTYLRPELISISEKSAQQLIYKIYLNNINNLPDGCGCGTSASIAYMGHSTGCVEFLHLHERESHEVLLAILKKKKNRIFGEDSVIKPKRAKFDQPENTEAMMETQLIFLVQRKPLLNCHKVQPVHYQY